MTDEEKRMMLLEERYATVRSLVRDAYEKCQIAAQTRQWNADNIKRLENKRNIFNKKKTDQTIDEILVADEDLETMMAKIRDYLEVLEEELESLERVLGKKAEDYYGRDDEWWVRWKSP